MWALFVKKSGQWSFEGFTDSEDTASEFEDEMEYDTQEAPKESGPKIEDFKVLQLE